MMPCSGPATHRTEDVPSYAYAVHFLDMKYEIRNKKKASDSSSFNRMFGNSGRTICMLFAAACGAERQAFARV